MIGAGVAGGLAAFDCARRGLRVLLVEKRSFPRWKVCGCCFNANASAALTDVGLPDLSVTKGCALGSTSARLEWQNAQHGVAARLGIAGARSALVNAAAAGARRGFKPVPCLRTCPMAEEWCVTTTVALQRSGSRPVWCLSQLVFSICWLRRIEPLALHTGFEAWCRLSRE